MPSCWGMPGHVGRARRSRQPTKTFGLLGFGGAVVRMQPLIGWTEPLRLETREPAAPYLRGLGAYSEAINIQSAARSISSSSPKFAAVRSALC
jgi:hypothetical protein